MKCDVSGHRPKTTRDANGQHRPPPERAKHEKKHPPTPPPPPTRQEQERKMRDELMDEMKRYGHTQRKGTTDAVIGLTSRFAPSLRAPPVPPWISWGVALAPKTYMCYLIRIKIM